MTIAFVHDKKSFLPEIQAYTRFFTARGIQCMVADKNSLREIKPEVAWYFMGTDPGSYIAPVTIHEYTSASVPPVAGVKNIYKRWFNRKPDYRVFLNEFVKRSLDFKDDVPFGFRDMGISMDWLRSDPEIDKQYDFIYVGELKRRNVEQLLDVFANKLKDRSLLVVSKQYEDVQQRYSNSANIIFKGPVPHDEIQRFIRESRFAINFIPDETPFSQQTSTKFLEYAACRVPIVTTDYAWVRYFEKQFGGEYFYLAKDISNLTWENLQAFKYAFPDLTEWTWEKQIQRSGVLRLLEQKFAGLSLRAS